MSFFLLQWHKGRHLEVLVSSAPHLEDKSWPGMEMKGLHPELKDPKNETAVALWIPAAQRTDHLLQPRLRLRLQAMAK